MSFGVRVFCFCVAFGETVPYTGTLNRGRNDSEAFSSALGALWVALGESTQSG
jgi:hypothetical protein